MGYFLKTGKSFRNFSGLPGGLLFKEDPIKSPEAIIKEFYVIYDLEYVKIMIWKMFKAAMNSDIQVFDLPEENSDIIFFLENFLMFNMAIYELHERMTKGIRTC
jgi:hypothetical protein